MTSDSVPTIAISQPPCTTLARCAVLRKVSTPKLSRDAEPQDERKQPERDRKLREAAQKEPRPNTSLAATMVKKKNTRRGSIRSAPQGVRETNGAHDRGCDQPGERECVDRELRVGDRQVVLELERAGDDACRRDEREGARHARQGVRVGLGPLLWQTPLCN